jgi:HipA-like protein
MDELRVLVNGELLGVVAERTNGDLVLTYEPSWQDRGDSFLLSLSLHAPGPAAGQVRSEGVEHQIIERLAVDVREHSERCVEVLGSS